MSELRWDAAWRARTWAALDQPWDLLVVGGGITGAGLLREATRAGLRALLLEQHDFAWGTSSRSTKLVHGGLRYLAQGHLRLAHTAVRERERLLREAPGLVTPQAFLFPMYEGQLRRQLVYRGALGVYEVLAGRVRRHGVGSRELTLLAPAVHRERLRGGLRYQEAQTDDARLVLRVLRQAVAAGGRALNGAKVTGLVSGGSGVRGVAVRDQSTGREGEVLATVVVNACGAWSDGLRAEVGAPARMRPVRGSHLLFPGWRFPLATGVNVTSPRDGRPVCAFPWEGATVVGSTDVDDGTVLDATVLDAEAAITADEVDYLLESLAAPFASLELTRQDVQCTWSGVRPLVSSGTARSHDELREHVVWDENGLLTVAGGKLTTFRVMAGDVLRAAAARLPQARRTPGREYLPPDALGDDEDDEVTRRLAGRHGAEVRQMLAGARPEELQPVGDSATTWAELRWSARCEAVTSLEDLMLRRTRLGLLLPAGGVAELDRVRQVCAEELGWDGAEWARQRTAYAVRLQESYAVPGTSAVIAPGSTSTATGSGPTRSPSA